MGSRWMRNSFIYLLILVAVIAIVISLFRPSSGTETRDLSQLIEDARAERIDTIEAKSDSLTVRLKDGSVYKSRKEEGSSIVEILKDNGIEVGGTTGVNVEVKGDNGFGNWIGILINFLPLIIFGAILIFIMRQAQGSNSQAMNFGRSRARVFTGNRSTITFIDVAGVEEAKEELKEVVEFLKYPERFAALGARIPRGVLLVGPPGTGKTLLAKAVAGEAGVPFFSISGSEFVEMFVGVGASRVRDLFDQAKRNSPCIVFVDEIDAVGRHRGSGLGGSHDEREQTLNQILVEMDGFDTNTNVIVISATNRPDVLDPALLRPGRFDRQVVLDRPDIRGRKNILDVHVKGKPLDKNVELIKIAKISPGFSGADLANVVNEAAILAARRNKKTIAQAEFEDALEKVALGPERRSRVITEKEKLIVAYHEAGHALCFKLLKHTNPVHKITVVSRGMAMGVTWSLPQEDRYFRTKKEFEDDIAAALGGWVAEQLHLGGDMTTGASNDIEKATEMARHMVTKYGMSEKLGPLQYGKTDELIFLGRQIQEERNYSEDVAKLIDSEVKEIVDRARRRAHEVLSQNRDKLDIVVQRLITDETMSSEEFDKIFEDGQEVPAAAAAGHPSEPPTGTTGADDQRRGKGPAPAPKPSPA